MRALIDTNLLIDYFGRRMPYFSSWEKLMIMHAFEDIELWAAPQSFADAFYILRKQIDPHELQRAFNESLSFIKVCNVGTAEICEATKRSWNDYEDCLIALCAENIDADVLLSRDQDGFKLAKTPVFSPEEFFEMIKDEYGIEYDLLDL